MSTSRSSTPPAATENTPLLRPSGPSSTPSYATSRHEVSDSSSITTVEGDDEELLSLLARATSNIGLGMEAEALPGIANTPDEHGDFKLPRDKCLELRKPDGDAEPAREYGELVGVTRNQFWVIFAGEFELSKLRGGWIVDSGDNGLQRFFWEILYVDSSRCFAVGFADVCFHRSALSIQRLWLLHTHLSPHTFTPRNSRRGFLRPFFLHRRASSHYLDESATSPVGDYRS